MYTYVSTVHTHKHTNKIEQKESEMHARTMIYVNVT